MLTDEGKIQTENFNGLVNAMENKLPLQKKTRIRKVNYSDGLNLFSTLKVQKSIQ